MADSHDMLKSFVRRIEATEDEIRVLNQDKSDIYKEAKADGFDVKVLRKVIAARRLDASERDEADAVFATYWAALHGGSGVGAEFYAERLVRAHVETIEEFRSGGASDARLPPKQEVAGSSPAQIAIQSTAARKDVPGARHNGGSVDSATAASDRGAAPLSSPPAGTQAPPVDTEPGSMPEAGEGGTASAPVDQSVPAGLDLEPAARPADKSAAPLSERPLPPGRIRLPNGEVRMEGCLGGVKCGSSSATKQRCYRCETAWHTQHGVVAE